jgi:AraC-like DNA-binding protein
MDEIAGRTLDIGELLGPEGRRLADALTDPQEGTDEWKRRFDLLDEFFLRRADAGPVPSGQVAWAWGRLVKTGGRAPIGGLADEVGWSRRHLIARFKQQVGLPPKTMARIIRFARLVRMIDAAGPVRWERLANECGYYDQAHLNRDFREFAGTTPTDFLARRIPGGSVVGDGVNSVQDTGPSAA